MNRTHAFFAYTLLITLLISPLIPNLRLMFFAPFLAFTFYHKGKVACLWLAFVCGMVIDLLSAQTRLGIIALNYCLTSEILYSQKRHFFEDSLSTLPIMTFLFVFISLLIQIGLLYLLGQGMLLSWESTISDLLWIPLCNAFYAGLAFTLPTLCLPKAAIRRTVLFSPKASFTC